MIVEIEAKFACDACGTEFIARLDPACSPPDGWTIMDVAENAIRGGQTYEDGHGDPYPGMASIQDSEHLCAQCTREADAEQRKEPT